MVLLIDDYRENRTIRLRNSLRAQGIPCIWVRADAVRDYPEALCAFVFASSEYMLSTVSLRCSRLPLLCVNESGSRIYNKDVTFYDPAVYISHEQFITEYLSRTFGIAFPERKIGGITLCEKVATYGLNRISLTGSEARILNLLTFCRGKWICEKNVLRTCFDNTSNSGRVPVHVCNINTKAKKAFGRKLISCKRGIGYMLAEDL